MNFKVCIDPGHGMGNIKSGYDPGACGGGLQEADIALQWALTLRWIGIRLFDVSPKDIILTRDDDQDITPVWKRDDFANNSGATHFISLHCNAGGITARGTETLYSEDKGRNRSMNFAKRVQDAAIGAVGSKDRGIKSERTTRHKDLAVFGHADKMDACLLEIGFISSPFDRKKLTSRDRRIWFAIRFWRDVMGLKQVGTL